MQVKNNRKQYLSEIYRNLPQAEGETMTDGVKAVYYEFHLNLKYIVIPPRLPSNGRRQ